MESIRQTTSTEDKAKLRKMKRLPAAVKTAVYKGAKSLGAVIQFNRDISVIMRRGLPGWPWRRR